mmetsp:Transcript_40924/g.75762  ORF Transcript_40924/g.75762 Transcript_40924/m.75762 type:complete len:371 (+) Transcript_40924:221-1333(+)
MASDFTMQEKNGGQEDAGSLKGRHNNKVDASNGQTTEIMLEAAMVSAGVRVFAVDDRRNEVYATREMPCDYEDRYWLCANGRETKGRPVSSAEAYGALRESLKTEGSTVIGVDLEGTSSLAAPDGVALMAQVASTSVVVIEYPRGRFSSELASLLADSAITKVFCGVDGDARYLGPGVTLAQPIVDLQEIVKAFDRCENPRSLEGILRLADASGAKWVKRSIRKEVGQQRWYSFRRAGAMITDTKEFARYAAADAWGTRKAYEGVVDRMAGDLPVLDEFLSDKSYLQHYRFSAKDVEVFRRFNLCDIEVYPNVRRWFVHIAALVGVQAALGASSGLETSRVGRRVMKASAVWWTDDDGEEPPGDIPDEDY